MIKGLHAGFLISSVVLIGFSVCPDSQVFSKPGSPIPKFNLQIPNHAPVVKIIQPNKNAVYISNSLVPYSIEVSDAEDGESKYQEIQSAEVLVKIKYVAGAVKASAYLKQKKSGDSVAVMSMLVSNCFNCHAVKTKLAGPSFLDISKRYENTISNRTQLVNHIQKGSTGIWGKEVMPTHPELTDTVARLMVKWIMTYANDPGLNYFVGLQGVLPLNKPKSVSRRPGVS